MEIPRFWACLLALSCAVCGEAPATDSAEPSDQIVLDPVATIGVLDGDAAYLFGDVRSVAVDAEGHIYVGDRIGATVRAYSPTGVYLAEVAREGEGPGEVQGWPADLTVGPDGLLYVRDATRVTVFGPRTAGALADSLMDVWRVPGYGNLTEDPSGVARDGTYLYPNGVFRTDEPPHFYYNVYRGGEITDDTLSVPQYEGLVRQRTAFYPLGPGGGRIVDGLNRVPFSAAPVWDATLDGTVLSSDGVSDTLLETDVLGDTVRTWAVGGGAPRAIPAEERADSLSALEERIDSLPVPLEEVVNLGDGVADRRLPVHLPSVVSVHVAVNGLVWVQRWPREGAADVRFYDVYGPDGSHVGAVVLSAPLASVPPPFFGDSAVVGVVVDGLTGVQQVVSFSLTGLVDPPPLSSR